MRFRSLAAIPLVLAFLPSPAAAEPVPDAWVTPAEAREFRATPSYDETLAFLRRLEAEVDWMKLDTFGTSAQGRPMPVVIVSKEKAFTPGAARATGRPVVMIQNGIHSGEIDGKDACLMILRDLALGRHPEILDAAILLIVPIYNVDGHERVSPYNRANQNGPVEGMGFRTTASGLDLNRDHLKIQSLEARALIGLFNDWRPHLHVDDHVTNGSDHAWVLTYSWVEAPQAAPSVDAWLRAHMPAVVKETAAAGHPLGPYVSLVNRTDPSKGFDSWVGGARYATGYFPLRNRPSILVENHAHKPYRERVLANRDFLLALVREVGRHPAALTRAVSEAEALTVALGKAGADPSDVVLAWKTSEQADTISFPVYDWYTEPSVVWDGPVLRFRRGELRETEVPWYHRPAPARTAARPRGYLVLPGWPDIEQRLKGHDLVVFRLTAATELEVETLRLAEPEFASGPYQGLTQVTSKNVAVAVETREVPAGTLWVPADQPDFEVAVQLLEPESPESLLSWGILSRVFERKEYIGGQKLDDLAREMLRDPEVAAAWKAALEDESFAADRMARYMWWYRRTPYWDEQVGLLPVYRVMKYPRFETETW